jgi:glutathione S-transferase
MAVEIFWGSGSPYSWRVLLALELKKLPYRSHLLQFSKMENKSPEFLAISPRGRVPALRDGDYVLTESVAILAYLDRKYPEPPLFGRTPEEAGRIWRFVAEYQSYVDAANETLVLPLYFGKAAEKADEIRGAAVTLHGELRPLEQVLAGSAWLAGDTISAADVVLYPGVQAILRAAGKEAAKPFDLGFLPFEQHYPALAAWSKRVEALPGYDRTYPPHWR